MDGHVSRRRIIIIAAIILALLVGAGIYTWLRVSTSLNQTTQTPTETSSTEGLSKAQIYVSQVAVDASKAAATGDLASANAVYDAAINTSADKSLKADLYIQKATTSMAAGDGNGALEAAKQAVELEPESFEALFILASMYERLGDNALAAEYYRKVAAIAAEPDDENPTRYGKQYYLDLAAELEG